MMRFIRPTTSLLSAPAAVAAIGLLAPRRLVSQYARPVNVMNSKSAPAQIRDTDNLRRTPYVSTRQGSDCSASCFFTAVPNNMRLVVTHFDSVVFAGACSACAGLSEIRLRQSNSPATAYPEFTAAAPAFTQIAYTSSGAIEYYVEAGSTPIVDFLTEAETLKFPPHSVTLTGYLIDCTTGCSPMVN